MSERRIVSKLRISEAYFSNAACGVAPTGCSKIWTWAREANVLVSMTSLVHLKEVQYSQFTRDVKMSPTYADITEKGRDTP